MTLTHQTNASHQQYPDQCKHSCPFPRYSQLHLMVLNCSYHFQTPRKNLSNLFYLKISAYQYFNSPQCFACQRVELVHRTEATATVWITLPQTALKQRETLPTCCNCGSAYTENCNCSCHLVRNERLKPQVKINSFLLLKSSILPSKPQTIKTILPISQLTITAKPPKADASKYEPEINIY